MSKVRLLTFALLLSMASAVQASKVCWIEHNGSLIHQWNIADGLNDFYVSESFYMCQLQVAYLTQRMRMQK